MDETQSDAPPVTPQARGLVEHFFRHETGRLHGALVRRFGIHNLALVEDVAQEALLRAMRAWSIGGIPANPSAWITLVAINLARDALRRRQMSAAKEPAIITHFELAPVEAADIPFEIRDDSLRLMFVCCHPCIAEEAQVVLALKMLCGFGTGEIARAFFSTEAAIEKQITRTKQRIRDAGVPFEIPEGAALLSRLDGVLATLYLLFNEGYKASSGEHLLREDLCAEAIRLAAILVQHPACDTPRSHALLALMQLTAARFPTRMDEYGALLRLEEQNRAKWDGELIDRGLRELSRAAEGDAASEYHLLAGIAAIHATAIDAASTDWAAILRHYNELMRLAPSPLVALNRAVAVAHVHGPQAALEAISGRKRLDSFHLLHVVEGEFHWRLGNHAAAAGSFRRALALARLGPEQAHIASLLRRIKDDEPLGSDHK